MRHDRQDVIVGETKMIGMVLQIHWYEYALKVTMQCANLYHDTR
jgi:hypothetical protein